MAFTLDRDGSDAGSVFDLAALVALIGWTLVEALILSLLRIFARPPSEIRRPPGGHGLPAGRDRPAGIHQLSRDPPAQPVA